MIPEKIRNKLRIIDLSRIKEIARRYKNHQITAFSAQMAFFLFLSVFPLAMFTLSIASRLNLNIDGLINDINTNFPPETKDLIVNIFDNYLKNESWSLLSVSGIIALWSASRGVIALRRAFNVAYGREENRNPFKLKLSAMFYTLVLIFSIIVTLALPAIGKGFFDFLENFFVVQPYIVQTYYTIRIALSVIVYLFFILIIHKTLPAGNLRFRDTIYGAVFSIAGWFLLSRGFNFFVSTFTDYALIYGGLASIVTLMVWMYLMSTVMMLGAEINSTILAYRKNDYPFDIELF